VSIARRHDVNANQLFKWRREMEPEQKKPATDDGIAMLLSQRIPAE
jgi:transposase-like protein